MNDYFLRGANEIMSRLRAQVHQRRIRSLGMSGVRRGPTLSPSCREGGRSLSFSRWQVSEGDRVSTVRPRSTVEVHAGSPGREIPRGDSGSGFIVAPRRDCVAGCENGGASGKRRDGRVRASVGAVARTGERDARGSAGRESSDDGKVSEGHGRDHRGGRFPAGDLDGDTGYCRPDQGCEAGRAQAACYHASNDKCRAGDGHGRPRDEGCDRQC